MSDSIFDSKQIHEVVQRLLKTLPSGISHLAKDLEAGFQTILQSAFQKMNLVTREEFDVQSQVLLRTRLKVERLERQLSEMEHHSSDQ